MPCWLKQNRYAQKPDPYSVKMWKIFLALTIVFSTVLFVEFFFNLMLLILLTCFMHIWIIYFCNVTHCAIIKKFNKCLMNNMIFKTIWLWLLDLSHYVMQNWLSFRRCNSYVNCSMMIKSFFKTCVREIYKRRVFLKKVTKDIFIKKKKHFLN